MNHVMIFGASSGLGAALSEIYKKNNWIVTEINRDACDLENDYSVEQLCEKLKNTQLHIQTCLFCSGYAEFGYVKDVPYTSFEKCMRINAFSIVRIFQTLAQSQCNSIKFGFVLSGAADFLYPGLSPYALSKRFLRDFIYFLNIENAYPRHKIITIYPGAMKTGFSEKARVYGKPSLYKTKQLKESKHVAAKIFSRLAIQSKTSINFSKMATLLGKIQSVFNCKIFFYLK